MNLRNILLCMTLLIVSVAYSQQTKTISGTVTDQSKSPLIGVTVLAGTAGTTTNLKGDYSIKVASNVDSIKVSYIGYKTQTIAIGVRATINVELQDDALDVEAIQIVAYGAKEKVTITGAISSMSGADVLKSPNASITNALAGSITGVSTVQSVGQPGMEDAQIFIRGTGSLSDANSSPLILVDGVERSFSQLDPNEVADITVLKDASATAVFGVRGANGVLLVTTKRGVVGKPKISLSSTMSLQSPIKINEMADSYTYVLGFNELSRNDGNIRGSFPESIMEAYRTGSDPIMYPNTNWYDYCFKDNYMQSQNNINISGGTERVKYFVSLGYLTQDGLLKTFDELPYDNNFKFNRYNYRANLDINVTKTTKLSLNLGGVYGVRQEPIAGGTEGLWRRILWSHPMSSPGIINGEKIKVDNRAVMGLLPSLVSGLDSFYGSGNRVRSTNDLNVDLGLSQDLSVIIKGLKVSVKGSYNTNYYIQKNRSYSVFTKTAMYKGMVLTPTLDMSDPNYDKEIVYTITGGNSMPMSYSETSDQGRNWYMEGALNYDRKFGDHSVSGLLLYNQSKNYYPKTVAYIPRAYVGLVGRVGYDYKKKYMVEFNAGYNGSENFAPGDTRFGFFPAVSAGWVLSEEKFMKNMKFINYLKFRASYGLVGNDIYGEVGTNRFLYMEDTYTINNGGYNFGVDSPNNMPAANESSLGNPSVSWETAAKQNYGIDLKLLKNRLAITADYFYDKRDGILIQRNTSPDIIAMKLPVLNMGEVHNSGYELEVKWNDKVSDFRYWVGGSVSFARNKIIYMDEIQPNHYYMAQTGRQTNLSYGYIFDRFYSPHDFESLSTGKLVEGLATPESGVFLKPGDVKYYDLNDDGILDDDDMTYMGYPENPEYIFSFTGGFSWKGFDFSMLWVGVTNTSRMLENDFRYPFASTGAPRGLMQYMYDERWTPETAETATFPRFTNTNRSYNFEKNSSLWLRDASYIRLKNVQLGYTFKNYDWMKKIGVENISFSLSGYNLLTFDRLKIVDPESKPKGGGQNQYPISKMYSLGIKLNF